MSANPIHYYGPASTDVSGVLDVFVRQPTDNSPSESNGVATYVEKWKGPYNVAKDCLVHIRSGFTISQVHTYLGTDKIQRYDIPACPYGYQWIVVGIEVQELEAGAHAILTVNYERTAIDSGSSSSDIPEADIWNLTWQSYQVTPWAFCKNDDYSLASYNWSPSDTPPDPDWSKTANRGYINDAITAPNHEIKDKFIVWTPDLNEKECRKYLPPANTIIYKKASLQRNATYHHPVLTHQSASELSGYNLSSFGDTLAEGLDTIGGLPTGCPYSFSGDWEWIKVGDDVTQTKSGGNTTFTRKQTWWGFPQGTTDKNFYGSGQFTHDEDGLTNGRWEIGKV